MIAESAVLNWKRAMSSPTRRIDTCIARRKRRRVRVAGRRDAAGSRAGHLGELVDEPPDARQEAPHALDALVGPLEVLLGRRHEQDVGAQRVGAEPLDDVLGRDDVALGLGHGGAVELHHALGEQVRERLVGGDQAHVAEAPS